MHAVCIYVGVSGVVFVYQTTGAIPVETGIFRVVW